MLPASVGELTLRPSAYSRWRRTRSCSVLMKSLSAAKITRAPCRWKVARAPCPASISTPAIPLTGAAASPRKRRAFGKFLLKVASASRAEGEVRKGSTSARPWPCLPRSSLSVAPSSLCAVSQSEAS